MINRTELAACVADSLARLGAGVEVGEDEAGDAQGEQAQGEEPGEGPREGLRRPTLVAVRAPRSVTVESFSEEEVAAAVRQLGGCWSRCVALMHMQGQCTCLPAVPRTHVPAAGCTTL